MWLSMILCVSGSLPGFEFILELCVHLQVAVVQLVKLGTISESAARLYLKASESARSFLATYYNLRRPLYFQFTHLVCRTALQGKKINILATYHNVRRPL